MAPEGYVEAGCLNGIYYAITSRLKCVADRPRLADTRPYIRWIQQLKNVAFFMHQLFKNSLRAVCVPGFKRPRDLIYTTILSLFVESRI